MAVSRQVTGTLRAETHGHLPLVQRETHDTKTPSRDGEGKEPVLCIVGNVIDRQLQNGGNGLGWQEDVSYTLTAMDRHAVYSRQRSNAFKPDSVAGTQSARQYKDVTDLVCDSEVYRKCSYADYAQGCSPLRAQGGDNGGGSENLICEDRTYQDKAGTLCAADCHVNNQYVESDKCVVASNQTVRRLTPLECERLQGFPDGWTDIPGASDSARYKALGNSVALPCVEFVMKGIAKAMEGEEYHA